MTSPPPSSTHLLDCADCWRAVREDRAGRAAAARLRDAAPYDLADRVSVAVEPAARPRPARRRGRWLAAGALALAAAVIALVVLALPKRGADPPAITAVVAAAQRIPAPTGQPAPPGAVAHGQGWTVRAGVAELRLQYYRLDGVDVLVAHADRPVGTPQDAQRAPPGDMPWTVDRDGITVYCPHDDMLVAAAVPADRLAALAQQLPRI